MSRVSSGETAGFELTPDAPGDLGLEVDHPGNVPFHAAMVLHVLPRQ